MNVKWNGPVVVFCILLCSLVGLVSSEDDITIACGDDCQATDSVITGQNGGSLMLHVTFPKEGRLTLAYNNQPLINGLPNFDDKVMILQGADSRFQYGAFKEKVNNKVLLPITFSNISLSNDNRKIISLKFDYFNKSKKVINESRVLNILAPPKECGSDLLKKQYTVEEKHNTSINFTLCGNPAPTVTARIGSKQFAVKMSEVVGESYQYRYTTSSHGMTQKECGKTLQFQVSGSNILLTTKMSVKFVPGKVENITAKLDYENCLTTTWKKIEAGNCVVTYELKYIKNGTEIERNLDNKLSWKTCNSSVNATVNIRAYFETHMGKYNDKAIKAIPPPVIVTLSPTTAIPQTIVPSKGQSKKETSPFHWKYILAIVVGFIAVILIISVVIIACMRRKSPKADNNNGQSASIMRATDESDYAEVNSLRSLPSTKEPPSDEQHMIYAELGPGGRRTGPKPVPEESNYAQVKTDGVYYPPLQQSFRGEAPKKSNFYEPPKYSVASRTKKPSDEDDYIEDILV